VVAQKVKTRAARNTAKRIAVVLIILIAKNDLDKALEPVLIDMS
jgi:hypothetical protein